MRIHIKEIKVVGPRQDPVFVLHVKTESHDVWVRFTKVNTGSEAVKHKRDELEQAGIVRSHF